MAMTDEGMVSLMRLMMARRMQQETDGESESSSSNSSEEDEIAEEFDFDGDYKIFKLDVQEDRKSPWQQEDDKSVKENDQSLDDGESCGEKDDWRRKQKRNLSVTGAMWAQLANMEKEGVNILESPFCPSVPQVLGVATQCQEILQTWLGRFVKEGASWEDGPGQRLVSMMGTEAGDYKMWLNYYQVEEGARAIMRRLSVGRVMLELGSQSELTALSRELEAAVSILRAFEEPAGCGQSLEEMASRDSSSSQDRAARLVELKYLLRVKACLANMFEWFRVVMFSLEEKKHIVIRDENKDIKVLDVVVTGELNTKRSCLVSSLRLLQALVQDKMEGDLLSFSNSSLLVSDSFICLSKFFEFMDYTSQGYQMPCHIVRSEDGRGYKYIQTSGYNSLEISKEDGTSEDQEIVWELSDGTKMKKIDIISGLGDYLLLSGKDDEDRSEEDDEESFFGLYSISKNKMVENLGSWEQGWDWELSYGKEGGWVTTMEYKGLSTPTVNFMAQGVEIKCENCEVLASSPYWVVMEDVVQSKIVFFSTAKMQVVCKVKMTINESDLITINQTSTMTNLDIAIISPTDSSMVRIFQLNANKGKLKKKLEFPVRKYENYMKVKEAQELGGGEIKSHNQHIVVPSPSAAQSVFPLKWTVYDVSSKGKRYVEMDEEENPRMMDDKIMFSFNMSETIVHLSFGLSVEEQVAHDFKMAEKVLMSKDSSLD
eukprot:GFUD01020771.1.p1 GENE.GFUD01020771.1~~GFUD01020771.1.p1  ORF type:complete len:713 (+),score=273.36 GFUD01020771.1:53-2191(+)